MASPHMNSKRFCLGGLPCDIFAEATFGSNGAPTLVTSGDKSRGVKALLQAKSASRVYMMTLNDKWVDLKMAVAVFASSAASHMAASSTIQRLSESNAVGGGVAVICPASATGADTVTIKAPGSAAVVLTAVAYNATPADNEFCVGNTTGANSETANNIAALIRNDAADAGQAGKGDTNGNGGSTTMPSGITAYAVGDVVVISCSTPGWMICTSHATRLAFKATGTGVAATMQTMDPGLVFMAEDMSGTITGITDNGGGATADGTIGAVTAPTALTDNGGGTADGTVSSQAAPVTLTDSSGYHTTHNDTVEPMAAITTLTDSTGAVSHDDTLADGLTAEAPAASTYTPALDDSAVVAQADAQGDIEPAAAGACAGGANPANTDVDTAIATAVAPLTANDATLAVALKQVRADVEAIRTTVGALVTDVTTQNQNDADLAQKVIELVAREAVAAQNFSCIAQKVIELVTLAGTAQNNLKEVTTRQAENRTAIIALTDAVKELSTKLNEVITATQAVPASGDKMALNLVLENSTRTI